MNLCSRERIDVVVAPLFAAMSGGITSQSRKQGCCFSAISSRVSEWTASGVTVAWQWPTRACQVSVFFAFCVKSVLITSCSPRVSSFDCDGGCVGCG